ncbi:FAD assembly factor SdhE [Falsiroseomonas selenitidurans]|uniref:FAD assembly factor SdhE n=1 Tax=Falsiroseomonas selenitidurans TaxID=2716335 RepID=UPI001ADE5806|nr:succinate dehydrogenase assembly factor 2 [Falsiroseomonas selenitidurans]
MSQIPGSLKLSDPTPADSELDPRRRRLNFRAWHRGTKETDLMVGAFVARHIATFTDAELDELEQILELPDVDLGDWLMQRRPIPAELAGPLLSRMLVECNESGAGLPPHLR